MSDNIQVAIRVRPLNQRELHNTESKKCVQVSRQNASINIALNSSTKTFAYDFVFDQDINQEDLFESIGKPIASSCLCGYNGSIFAYGQTGSGKTFTIMGALIDTHLNVQSRGILPRCLEYIFTCIKRELKKNPNIQYLVKGSFLEIYNEQINDLLAPELTNLQIREDIKKGAYVEALHQDTVTSFDETFKLLDKGIRNRHIGSTSMNEKSSRSHSVFTLQVESKEKHDDIINFKNSFFHLIDLAGSERQKMAETFGERLKEASMINKSLSSLGNVINSLVEIAEGRQRHVPYRDSKLTFLLKDSLGGNSKTCIIANISPSLMCYGETLSTLRFAERAKMVKNRAVVNEDTTGTLSELREEVKRLKTLLKTQQDSPGQGFSIDFSERIKQVESLLEQNLRIRLQSENALKVELTEQENYISELNSALQKCEKKISADRKIIKAKDENLKKLQKNENFEEKKLIVELKNEIDELRKENENHPIAAILQAENLKLKHEVSNLEKEMKESNLSLKSRLQESQDFTEKLQVSLRKSVNEREQLHILLEEYSKKAKTDGFQELSSAKKTILELKKSLEMEKNRVLTLENQLNALTESQLIEDSSSSRFSTLNSSGIVSLNDADRQNEQFQRFLQDHDIGSKDLEEKITHLEKNLEELKKENKNLAKYEVENFKLEEEIDKLRDENMNKDNKIEELQNEIETMIAENEFLSTQFIEFSQQLILKEKKINELTEKLSTRPNKTQIEENLRLKVDLDDFSSQNKDLLFKYDQMKEEFELSVNSRREMIEQLKKLQDDEVHWRTECQELRSQLEEIEKENEKIKENFDDLSNESSSVTGSNNLNQKIKLHSKMKDENNKLKDQNFQLREELRKKSEKIEFLNKKVENAGKVGDSELGVQDKIQGIEGELERKVKEIEDIRGFVFTLPLENELKSESLGEKIVEAFNLMCEERNCKQGKIEDLEKELGRKNMSLSILENELLLLKKGQGTF